MISAGERAYLQAQAYVPEHLPHYVTAIAAVEPYLLNDFVIYCGREQLILVGYPLAEPFDPARLDQTLDAACARFDPRLVSVAAPALPAAAADSQPAAVDYYYRLELPGLAIPPKVKNMLRRAGRDVTVSQGQRLGREHRRFIDSFCRSRPLDPATRAIFDRLPAYITAGPARLFEARTAGGKLAAFDVADFGAERYAFYMFNFTDPARPVPGAAEYASNTSLVASFVLRQSL